MTDLERELRTSFAADAQDTSAASPTGERPYEDFAVGDYAYFTRQFSPCDFAAFAELSGDRNPLHHDPEYARQSGFAGPIAPLMLAAAPLSTIAGMLLPGRRSLVLDCQLRALRPVEYERPICYSTKIVAKHDAERTLALQTIAFDGANVLLEGRMHVRVRDDVAESRPEAAVEAIRGNAHNERVAFITGAAGDIGRAVSRALARRGWRLILQGRDLKRLDALARECRLDGAEAWTLAGDLTSADERREILLRLADLPAPTALLHAASPPIDAPLGELIEVNYAALRDLTESLVKGMLRRQRGCVAFVGSAAADFPQPGWENYAAAKQAATGYLRAFDGRYAAYGVCGTVVAPGFVLGQFSQAWRPAGAECLLPEEAAEAIVEELAAIERRPGGYLRLAPGVKHRGEFGFHQTNSEQGADALSNGTLAAMQACDAAISPVKTPSAGVALDELVRRFFRLPHDASLAEAGLGATPGWDSLGHLQLVMHLEAALGVSFTSGELSRTTRYADLQRLVDAKRPSA